MEDWREEMHWWVHFTALELYGLRSWLFGPETVGTVEVDAKGGRYQLKRLAVLVDRPGRVLVRPFRPDNAAAILRALNRPRSWMKARALGDGTLAVDVPPVPEKDRKDQIRRVRRAGRDAKASVKSIAQRAALRLKREGPIFQREVERSAAEVIDQLARMVAAKLRELGAGPSK
jgi:ribosome recycling factor